MPGAADWYDPPEDGPLYSAPPPAASADLVAPDRQRVTYTVQPGDTLTGIAADLQNTPRGAGTIATLNRLPNANRIQAGQQLQVTPADVGRLPSAGAVQVQQGDTLEGIAGRLGVDPTDLYRANAHQIANPNNIYPGQRLSLPYSPSTTPPATAADTSSAATSSAQAPAGPPQSTAGQERRQSDLDRRFADLQQSMAASNVQDRKENQDGTYYLADRPLADQPKGLGFDADGWIRHVRDSLGNGLGGLVNVSDNGAGPQSATGEPASVPQSAVDAARTAYQATFSGEHARAGEQELAAQPVVPDVLGGVRQGVQDIAQGVQNRDVLGTLGGAAQVLGAAGVALPGALGAERLVARGAKAAEAADTVARGALPKAGDLADTAQAGAESARAPEVQTAQELPAAARPEAPPAEPAASTEPAPATPSLPAESASVQPAQPAQAGNPYMLPTEPGPGRVPLSDDELVTHVEGLAGHYEQLDQRIQLLENRLEGGSFTRGSGGFRGDVVRPPWGAGWTDDALRTLAQKNGFNPYQDGWWEQAGFVKGSGELREDVGQSGLRGTGATQQTATDARRELATLRTQRDQVLAAIDHLDQAPEGARFYAPEPPSTELPFDSGVPDNASDATPATDSARANPSGGPARPQDAPGSLEAAAGAREPASGAGSPAPAGPATFAARLEALQANPAYENARPIQQVQFVQALAEGRLPDDMLAPAAAAPADNGPLASAAPSPAVKSAAERAAGRAADLRAKADQIDASGKPGADYMASALRQEADRVSPLPPPSAPAPIELNAGLTPKAVINSGQTVFAPATLAPQPVQDALNTFDSQVRGAAARIDSLVGRQQLAQDAGDKLYATTKATGYRQFLSDVAASPDGVMPKGAGVSRPAGWMDGSALGAPLDRVYVSPDVATVVGNIRDQVNGNTLADTLGAVNKGFGLVKEATLGGSVYHLGQEAMQAARLTRENAPAVLGASIANTVDPTGTLYQRLRTSSTWAPWFERASDAGVTQLSRTPEGELVDLMRGPKGLALRTGTGAVAGAIKGGLGASPDQDRFTEALKGAGLGAAFGAFGSYMVPALWERGIPTMKTAAFRTLVERGMSDQAAATAVNNTLGGENLVRVARSPVVSATMRATMFASDWWTNWGRNVFRAINPADWSEVGKEAKAYTAATLISGAVAVEGLNRLFAGHSALDNDPGHLADVDMTRQWGSDPKTGGRQYVNFLGPVADILNAVNDPGGFLTRRLGYLPNLASEASTGKTLSGYPIPNVQAELQGGKPYTPTDTLQQRALAVAAQQIENAYPAGASSAQRMYEAGGLPAAAVSVLTGARESSYRPPRTALPPKYIGVSDPIQQQRIDDAIKKVNAWERDPRSPRPTPADRQLDNRYGGNLSPAYSRALEITRGLAPRPQAPQAPQRDLSRAPEPAGSR